MTVDTIERATIRAERIERRDGMLNLILRQFPSISREAAIQIWEAGYDRGLNDAKKRKSN